MSAPVSFDFIIVGAGIAGASTAHWLAGFGRTAILERESQPGYHTTGRSAAQFITSYGPSQARRLSLASLPFFQDPPAGFSATPLLRKRAVLAVAGPGQQAQLDEAWQAVQSVCDTGRQLTADEVCALVPALRRSQVMGGVLEPESWDMDVAAMHQGYLRGARQQGAQLWCDAEVASGRCEAGQWLLTLRDGRRVSAPVVVNAAGAWGDVLATACGVRPVGLVPKRRTAFMFAPPAGAASDDWPLVHGVDGGWYFKPDAGQLLGSPANEDPMPPQDVQPEDIDVALAVDRIETATTMVVRPRRAWAGLRSFVPDEGLVGGFDDAAPGFFWCVGQGGYGIQTSAAMGQACAHLAAGRPLPETLGAHGIDAALLSPQRLRI